MNQSLFNISVQDSIEVLKDFGMFRDKGVKSISKSGVSDQFKGLSQKGRYKETFLTGLSNFDYDILLSDQSFFQFQIKKEKSEIELRYAFFQTPFEYKSYDSYVFDEIISKGHNESIEEIGDLFQLEYQQFLEEQEAVENYTTIRYDFEAKGYRPLIHSTSHIHIGHRTNVRIPVNKTLTPFKFVLFVLKQVYYPLWKDKANKDITYIESRLKKARVNCSDLNYVQWKTNEKLDLHIV